MPVVCARLIAHGLFLFTDCALHSGAPPMPSACRGPRIRVLPSFLFSVSTANKSIRAN